MRLPYADEAIVDSRKLLDYVLSFEHSTGRFKAHFFANLGFGLENMEKLEAEIRRLAVECDAETAERNAYGQKHVVRDTLLGSEGRSVDVITGAKAPIRHGLPGGLTMKHETLDTVVLGRDLPEKGLREGDLGAVVEVYEPDGIEVEFVKASGHTAGLVTLRESDVRPVADTDLVTVRTLKRTA